MPRNPNIISFFRYARQSENAGYGIDKIHRWKRITNLDVQFHSDLSYTTVAFMLPEKNAVAEKMSRNQTADQTLDQTAESSQSLVKNQGVSNCVSGDNSSVCNKSVNHQTRN